MHIMPYKHYTSLSSIYPVTLHKPTRHTNPPTLSFLPSNISSYDLAQWSTQLTYIYTAF
ncbi:predicted protein [Botrytis cinerea T4]|uniref:Uncharacterized protein n=1 Tax=Botryotinia fuckeliana (strain T4) TaxID=999810 RepID=G2YZN0_BOTF4|nr:predicted protein [Botrytis cinerea T4]